ncbi:MAG: efflux RND transporter permease subunit [Acidobacteria bacterium]|nr:MAG: efflux RND transporter permease subunit [Acidobacteriota bacterium]
MAVVVVGLVAATGLPVELLPRGFDPPHLRVVVPWRDAPPQETLDKITKPLEEELSTVRGLGEMRSYSRSGRAVVSMTFKQGTDMDVAYREVRDRVERARRSFPDDVDRVFIRKEDPSGIPVQVYGVAVDARIDDIWDLVQQRIVRPIERIDGVASVELNGVEEKEILIELDRERTSAAGLNIYALANQLQDDNFTMASGWVREGSRKLLLRSVARYRSVEDLENRLVAPHVRLGDIATIRYAEAEKIYRVRANSRPAFAVVVFKEGDANTREVARRVDRVFDELQRDPRLRAFGMISIFDQGEVIEESLRTLLSSGLIGGLIAGAVLFFFLRRFRMMIVVALAIPLSLMIALTVMYFAGETLNLLSLLGLMICVGLLVDNAVVVSENIYRLHRDGLPPREAALRGTSEIALAITMSTLTTIVVFLPVSLIEGPARFFLLRMSIPISVALVASLLVALVFVPLCIFLTLGAETRSRLTPTRPGAVFARARDALIAVLRRVYGWTFGALGTAYGRLLAVFLRRRLELVLLTAGVFGLTVSGPLTGNLDFVNQQEGEKTVVRIFADMPASYTLDDTAAYFRQVERIVEQHREEWGLDGWLVVHVATWGRIEAFLETPRPVPLTAGEITAKLKALLPRRAGVEIFTEEESESEQRTPTVYAARLEGRDAELLERTARQLEEVMVKVPGVIGVRRTDDPRPNEIGLQVDRARVERLGVDPRAIAGVVGYALRGAMLPHYSHEGRQVSVRIRFEEEDREDLAQLESFLVPTASGGLVPLSALTRRELLAAPAVIRRVDRIVSRPISLDLEPENVDETRARLARLLARVDLPEGVRIAGDLGRQRDNEDLNSVSWAAMLSIVFIFLLMGFLFESLVLPLSILLTIPLAWIGVAWAHVLTGRDIDFLGAVGVVLLIGVVVNNGIVLIDYVNRLRADGMPRGQAVPFAAARRFRPIMMTAITTVGGMIPLAFAGASSIGLSYTSFSLALIGGMTTSTLLTLLVVPVFYTLFDDARQTVGRLARALLAGPGAPAGRTDP